MVSAALEADTDGEGRFRVVRQDTLTLNEGAIRALLCTESHEKVQRGIDVGVVGAKNMKTPFFKPLEF